jgi:PadR family transcriptional regulator, regulatory protein PadR
MAPRSRFSAQTLAVLAALGSGPEEWHHGYALAKQTQLKSGTLYPILIRLAERGLVEACWEDEPQPGRPRRHQYRLSADGLQAAAAALADGERTARASAAGSAGRRSPRQPAPARGLSTAPAEAAQPGRARPAPRRVPAPGFSAAPAGAQVPS